MQKVFDVHFIDLYTFYEQHRRMNMGKFKKVVGKSVFKSDTPLNRYKMLHFGKYKGSTCEEVAYKDPDYMDWLSKEPTVQFDNDLMILVEECLSWKNNWDFEDYEKEMFYADVS